MTDSGDRQPVSPRVLVVEDEPIIRRFYERFCESQGYTAVLAPTGNAAMELLESSRDFDVILLDVRLPGVSGRALWKMMELNRPELCSRVIMVTADILSESTAELIETSGRPYLLKPFSTEQLSAAIEDILRSRREKPGKGHLLEG